MLSKDDDLRMTVEVIDYLNTYPAFNQTRGERINGEFFDQYISDAMTMVTVDHDRNRVFAEESENQPLANYCSAIWGIDGYMMTMGEAEDLLRWMEPRWCEFKGIDSSGFFPDDSVTLDDEEDFVV